MPSFRSKTLLLVLVIGLSPALAFADSGEGLLEILFIQLLMKLNLIWPFLLPLGMIGQAKKKLTLYFYSLAICGTLAGLLVYLVPYLATDWLDPEFTLKTLRIALAYLLVATALAGIAGWFLSRLTREFNDSHD